ncbi:ribosome silencing factor [Limnohabitans sp. JirII-31]|uniref:ribosome silencing factor n=1 Tax=Limnohabitans sp. JirII-31 TaxID=1977908 RepID=UPI000C1EEA7F|nr:ribosome silencing factor [Limnohabitans sp. JirII-31]PIT80899.1 ribosome silencing factor [Limnohabitans sp. JirII-31]
MTESTAKKDVQKLQRCIVDALEDVKAQGLAVFDTEHLSSLFERVIIASGTSNRQTKALAASVRDKVREAGFPKPRIEGEDNGEWIIVDCGAAVVHVMQPNIRQYYNLEEIWGEKPVRLKFGAPKPAAPVVEPKVIAKKPAAKKTPAKKTTAKKVGASQSVATKTASKSSIKPISKPVTKVVGKPVARKTTAKPVAKKSAAKKTVARKA